MARRRAAEEVTVVAAPAENPKRDLLEAFAPDIVSSDRADWLWDSLSILGQFSPEELQRLQVAVLLLILERQYLILEKIQNLAQPAGTTIARDGVVEGFDVTYFRGLIAQELGEEPDEETMAILAKLAQEPGRLERAIASTRRYLEREDVAKPLGLLISKLRSWQQEDRERAKRYHR